MPTTPAPSEEIEGLLTALIDAAGGEALADHEGRDEAVAFALKIGAIADRIRTHYTALLADRERLRQALGLYAREEHWHSPSTGFAAQYDPGPSVIERDGGKAARDTIASIDSRAARVPHE